MGFSEAISACLSKYATFEGRARRSEYWWFALFVVLVDIVAVVLDVVLGLGFIIFIALLALLLPTLAAGVRRLHDTDKSGWWLLISLVPFGSIVLLVFYCLDGTPGPNRYGPSPKYATGPAGY